MDVTELGGTICAMHLVDILSKCDSVYIKTKARSFVHKYNKRIKQLEKIENLQFRAYLMNLMYNDIKYTKIQLPNSIKTRCINVLITKLKYINN